MRYLKWLKMSNCTNKLSKRLRNTSPELLEIIAYYIMEGAIGDNSLNNLTHERLNLIGGSISNY